MNYGEDELGSFGDENEIKVSFLGIFVLLNFRFFYLNIGLESSRISI